MIFDQQTGHLYAIESYDGSSLLDTGDAIVVVDFEKQTKMIFLKVLKNSGMHFSDIAFDDIHNELFVSGAYRKESINNNNLIEDDSVFSVNIASKKITHLSLFSDTEEGKEGDLGEISVLPRMKKVYVTSVYAQGGKKVLYILQSQEKGLVKLKEIKIPDSPRAMEIDVENNLVYVLGHYTAKDDLQACIYVIDGISDNVVRIIKIEERIVGISPGERNLLAFDRKNQILYAIVNHKLFLINLMNDSVRCLFNENHYYKVVVDYLTGLVYAAKLIQTENETPYMYTIDIIANNNSRHELKVPLFVTSITKMAIEPQRKILCISTTDYSGRVIKGDMIFFKIDKF